MSGHLLQDSSFLKVTLKVYLFLKAAFFSYSLRCVEISYVENLFPSIPPLHSSSLNPKLTKLRFDAFPFTKSNVLSIHSILSTSPKYTMLGIHFANLYPRISLLHIISKCSSFQTESISLSFNKQ